MFSMSKNNGAKSSCGDVKRGSKGRVDLYAEKNTNTKQFNIVLNDYGNYGRLRHNIKFENISKDDIISMIVSLQALVNGEIVSTQNYESSHYEQKEYIENKCKSCNDCSICNSQIEN